jgi:poly(ADP-ribose) glycohydrolase
LGRKWCHVVAIDAINYRDPSTQYRMKNIKRELIKAYIGFYSYGQTPSTSFPITTGSWGCGAFNGDTQLKGRHFFKNI